MSKSIATTPAKLANDPVALKRICTDGSVEMAAYLKANGLDWGDVTFGKDLTELPAYIAVAYGQASLF